jgi:D-glycero-alpha-D-manno-heptose-7-phosphate kinase
MGDIPSSGSGMGSSSTVTVGLLNAMYQYLGEPKDAATLARGACEIERDVLGKPIGVQDQYIAAYGGQRMIRFTTNGEVHVANIALSRATSTLLNSRLMLFYTNRTRTAASVLAEQQENIPDKLAALSDLKCLVDEGRSALESGRLDDFGRCLDEGWRLKRTLASGIATPAIDAIYLAAKSAGAGGGKILGAGGGGFLMLYSRPEYHEAIRAALTPLPEMTFDLEGDGSKVIFNQKRTTTWITRIAEPRQATPMVEQHFLGHDIDRGGDVASASPIRAHLG